MRATKWDKDDDKVAISVLLLIQRILQSERATHTHTHNRFNPRPCVSQNICICRYKKVCRDNTFINLFTHSRQNHFNCSSDGQALGISPRFTYQLKT